MKFELEKADGATVVAHLFGALSERSSESLRALDAELVRKHVVFDMAGVNRVNPAGEALWATLLNSVARRADYEFRGCSVYFIEAVNRQPELARGGKITSFHAPLKCPACRHSATVLLESATVSPRSTFGAPPCGKCGRAMEAEVPPAAYFGFLFGD